MIGIVGFALVDNSGLIVQSERPKRVLNGFF